MTAPEPGPLGEEAARLVDAVRDWAARTFPDVDRALADGGLASSTDAATGAEECRYCPVCQAISVLRGQRPEVTDRLADAVTAAAGALAAVTDALTRPATRQPQPTQPTPPADGSAPGVQPIPVDPDTGTGG